MIKTAIILAAGRGTRMNGVGDDRPKGFLSVGGITLIERSVQMLLEFGIDSILIVTGFNGEYYENLAEKYDSVTTVTNLSFESTGSMYSYYCARNLISDDVLLLESDLIYEDRAIAALLESDDNNVILMSGRTGASDEVFIETGRGCLVNMSKDPDALGSIDGELVGISKISFPLYQEMIRTCDKLFADSLNVDYETCLVETAKRRPVACLKIEELVWAEIDNQHHYERVENIIYPKLLSMKAMADTARDHTT